MRDYDSAVGRYVESDPIGLAGGGHSTYNYANGNPISGIDRNGLQVEGEEDEEAEEAAAAEAVTRAQIDDVVAQIKQYDPNFRYATIGPPNYRYNQQDIDTLQDILRQYKSETSCRINYGRTPQGTPFTRHHGAETGPVRNLPGSLPDAIVYNALPTPGANNTTVYYDQGNNVTVVVGANGIVSAHQGPPRSGRVP
jgi:uncharacterized protein RhaS with RHS repeats